MVGEPLLKIMFGPEKGLLGVEKRQRDRVKERLLWWRILIREATASHGAGLTRTRRSEPTPSFFLFSERERESGNRTEGDRVRKNLFL